jgi:hypothetical protein
MHNNATHMASRLYHLKCMGMLLEWCAQNMHLNITFMHGMHGLSNFVWKASDTRLFSHAHAMDEVYQHDIIQADNLSNSVDMKLHITRLVCM